MEEQFAGLYTRITRTVNDLDTVLHDNDALLLTSEYTRWASEKSWNLINAADPCGT
jgi:hypothetical protein